MATRTAPAGIIINMFTALTHDIRVTATPNFESDQSDPDGGLFVFSYKIDIVNEGRAPVQLLSRYWIIIDGDGRKEEVQGPGVIGQQPVIPSGSRYSYSSFCPLPTEVGSMRGTYRMRAENGEEFDVAIPTFTLAVPNVLQ
ncbi:MAG: Co2+/Mg2+ efflux protein ApaG [bacterium]|nr:Co2+/Mg2+ efflux protein ApaG [bacterium]